MTIHDDSFGDGGMRILSLETVGKVEGHRRGILGRIFEDGDLCFEPSVFCHQGLDLGTHWAVGVDARFLSIHTWATFRFGSVTSLSKELSVKSRKRGMEATHRFMVSGLSAMA